MLLPKSEYFRFWNSTYNHGIITNQIIIYNLRNNFTYIHNLAVFQVHILSVVIVKYTHRNHCWQQYRTYWKKGKGTLDHQQESFDRIKYLVYCQKNMTKQLHTMFWNIPIWLKTQFPVERIVRRSVILIFIYL